jgi:hypothetical protein
MVSPEFRSEFRNSASPKLPPQRHTRFLPFSALVCRNPLPPEQFRPEESLKEAATTFRVLVFRRSGCFEGGPWAFHPTIAVASQLILDSYVSLIPLF